MPQLNEIKNDPFYFNKMVSNPDFTTQEPVIKAKEDTSNDYRETLEQAPLDMKGEVAPVLTDASGQQQYEPTKEELDDWTQFNLVLQDALGIPLMGAKMVDDLYNKDFDTSPDKLLPEVYDTLKQSYIESRELRKENKEMLDYQRKNYFTYYDKFNEIMTKGLVTFGEMYLLSGLAPTKYPTLQFTRLPVPYGKAIAKESVSAFEFYGIPFINTFSKNLGFGGVLSTYYGLKDYVLDGKKTSIEEWGKDAVKFATVATALNFTVDYFRFKWFQSKQMNRGVRQKLTEPNVIKGEWANSPKDNPFYRPEYSNTTAQLPVNSTNPKDFDEVAKEVNDLFKVTEDTLGKQEAERVANMQKALLMWLQKEHTKQEWEIQNILDNYQNLDDYNYFDPRPFQNQLTEPSSIVPYNERLKIFKVPKEHKKKAIEIFDLESLIEGNDIETFKDPYGTHPAVAFTEKGTFKAKHSDILGTSNILFGSGEPNPKGTPKTIEYRLNEVGAILKTVPESFLTDIPFNELEYIPEIYHIPNSFIDKEEYIGFDGKFNDDYLYDSDAPEYIYKDEYLTEEFIAKQLEDVHDKLKLHYRSNGYEMDSRLKETLYRVGIKDDYDEGNIDLRTDTIFSTLSPHDKLGMLYYIKSAFHTLYKEGYKRITEHDEDRIKVRRKQFITDLYYKLLDKGFTEEQLKEHGIVKESGQLKILLKDVERPDEEKSRQFPSLGVALNEVLEEYNLSFGDLEQLVNEYGDYDALARYLLSSKFNKKAIERIVDDHSISNRVKSAIKYSNRMDERIHKEFREYLEFKAFNPLGDDDKIIQSPYEKEDEILLTTEFIKHLEEQLMYGDKTGIYFTGRYAMMDTLGRNWRKVDRANIFTMLPNYFDDDYVKSDETILSRTDVGDLYEQRNPKTRTTTVYHSTSSDLYGALIKHGGLKGNPLPFMNYRGPAFATDYENGLAINKGSVSRDKGSKTDIGGVIIKLQLPDEEYYHIVNDSSLWGAYNWGDVAPNKRNTTVLSPQYIQSIVSIETGAVLYENEDVYNDIKAERLKNLKNGNNREKLVTNIAEAKKHLLELQRSVYTNYEKAIDKDAYINKLRKELLRIVSPIKINEYGEEEYRDVLFEVMLTGKPEEEMDYKEFNFYSKVVGRDFMSTVRNSILDNEAIINNFPFGQEVVNPDASTRLANELYNYDMPEYSILNIFLKQSYAGMGTENLKNISIRGYYNNLPYLKELLYGFFDEKGVFIDEKKFNFINELFDRDSPAFLSGLTDEFAKYYINTSNETVLNNAQAEALELQEEYENFKDVFSMRGFTKLKKVIEEKAQKEFEYLDRDEIDEALENRGSAYLSKSSINEIHYEATSQLDSVYDNIYNDFFSIVENGGDIANPDDWEEFVDTYVNVDDFSFFEILFDREQLDNIKDFIIEQGNKSDNYHEYLDGDLIEDLRTVVHNEVENSVNSVNDAFLNRLMDGYKENILKLKSDVIKDNLGEAVGVPEFNRPEDLRDVFKLRGYYNLRRKYREDAKEQFKDTNPFVSYTDFDKLGSQFIPDKNFKYILDETRATVGDMVDKFEDTYDTDKFLGNTPDKPFLWRKYIKNALGEFPHFLDDIEIEDIEYSLYLKAKKNKFSEKFFKEGFEDTLEDLIINTTQKRLFKNNEEYINRQIYNISNKAKIEKAKALNELQMKAKDLLDKVEAKQIAFDSLSEQDKKIVNELKAQRMKEMQKEKKRFGTNFNDGITEQAIVSRIFNKATYIPFKMIMSLSGMAEFTSNHLTSDILSARLMEGRTTLFNALGNMDEFTRYLADSVHDNEILTKFNELKNKENPTFADYYRFLDESLLVFQLLSGNQQDAYAKLNLSVSLKANANKSYYEVNNYIKMHLKKLEITPQEWDDFRKGINTTEWDLFMAKGKFKTLINNILDETTVDKMKELKTPITGSIYMDANTFLKRFFIKTMQKGIENAVTYIDDEGVPQSRFSREGGKDFINKISKNPKTVAKFLLMAGVGIAGAGIGGIIINDLAYGKGSLKERLLTIKNDIQGLYTTVGVDESILANWGNFIKDTVANTLGLSALMTEGENPYSVITSLVKRQIDKTYEDINGTLVDNLTDEEKWYKMAYDTGRFGFKFILGIKAVQMFDNLMDDIEEYTYEGLIDGSNVNGYYDSEMGNWIQGIDNLIHMNEKVEEVRTISDDPYFRALMEYVVVDVNTAKEMATARLMSPNKDEYLKYLEANDLIGIDREVRAKMELNEKTKGKEKLELKPKVE